MDSAKGCLQSSNDGGDDEFDSYTNSLSSFQYSSTDATSVISALRPQPPPPPPPLPPSSSLNHHFFDSPSGLELTPFLADLSSSPAPTTSAGIDFGVGHSSVRPLDKFRTTNVAAEPPQSSKKRTRASRRAPTTVLTTDPSNFRAMVQEFTGIRSPPLSAALSPYVRACLSLLQPGVGFHDPPSALPPPSPAASFLQLPLPFMEQAQSLISSAGAAQSQALLSIRSPNLAPQSLQPSFLAKNSTLPTMSAQLETRPQTPPPSSDALNELHLPWELFASDQKHSIYSVADRNSGSQQEVLSNTACKLYSGSNSPGLNVEKGSVAETRGDQGIVDSRICSSD